MKRIIDMLDTIWDWIVWGFPDEEDKDKLIDLIKNGTPIPEDATNGDVITSIINPDDENCVLICAHDGTVLLEVTEDWWNAPYKGENNAE